MSHFGQKKKAAPERPPERRFAAMWPKCQCRINRIPNRAAGTTGASGGGDRVSDGVLKLGQDALSTSHYHDSGSSIVRQVVPGRGRRERLAPCARNKTPLRNTAAWPARGALMLRLRSPSLGGAGGDTRRRDRKGGRAPFDARTTSSPQERLAPARHARAIRRRCAARRPGPRGALAPHLGTRRRSGAGGERRRLHIRPRLGSRPGERQGWLTAAGDLPRRCTPPRRRREPPPAASRLPPRGSWRWTQLRRSAPPIYSTETRVTAGRATGLVDGRR